MLFISFKDCFSGDIQRATISSSLKPTALLAYQSVNLKTQNVSKSKGYVCSMAASLAFKEFVSLDQILGACFWWSYSTITNFCLNVVAWKSNEGRDDSLGPVVCAQHVVYL